MLFLVAIMIATNYVAFIEMEAKVTPGGYKEENKVASGGYSLTGVDG